MNFVINKYTLKRITEMLCCSRDAQLRLGFCAVPERLGKQLLLSVKNIKKVQSKQYLTAEYFLECVIHIL